MIKEIIKKWLGLNICEHNFSGYHLIELNQNKPVYARAHLEGEFHRVFECYKCGVLRFKRPMLSDIEIDKYVNSRKRKGMKAIAIWHPFIYPKDHFGKKYKDLKFNNRNECIGYKK